MSRDTELWVFTPVTGTMVGIFVGIPLVLSLFFLDGMCSFLVNNSKVIYIVFSVVSIVLMGLHLVVKFSWASLLGILAGAISSSQMLYLFYFGLNASAIDPNGDVLGFLGDAIVFMIWLAYMLLNIAAVYLTLVWSIGSLKEYKSEKVLDPVLWGAGSNAVVGVIGWALNWLFFMS